MFVAITLAALMLPVAAFAMPLYIDITVTGAEEALTLDVESSDSIYSVKEKIRESTGIPEDEQTLYYGDTLLDDGRTIADYNIQKNSTLRLEVAAVVVEGDLNGDGRVNAADAAALLYAVMHPRGLTAEEKTLYDRNGDGRVNYRDAIAYLTWLAETDADMLDYFDMNGNGFIDFFDILILL